MRKLLNSVSLLSVLIAAPIVTMSAATAEDKLEALTKSEDNWAMQGKNYSSNHYSTLTQVNADNVKNLKVAWSFSTGLLQRSRRLADRRRRQNVCSHVFPQ